MTLFGRWVARLATGTTREPHVTVSRNQQTYSLGRNSDGVGFYLAERLGHLGYPMPR